MARISAGSQSTDQDQPALPGRTGSRLRCYNARQRMETSGMDAERELELATARALEWPSLLEQL
ncbi:MAG TPA: hypothetical protein VER33_21125, partial [Polyangiaceae bacterium]|nr:hypothetical protein [Polyangiaceae bacterium]